MKNIHTLRVTLSALFLISCGKTQLKGAADTPQKSADASATNTGTNTYTDFNNGNTGQSKSYTWQANITQPPLDLVISVDASAYMQTISNQVTGTTQSFQEQLKKLGESLKSQVDLNITVISNSTNGVTKFDSTTMPGVKQHLEMRDDIPNLILGATASSLCPATSVWAPGDGQMYFLVCGVDTPTKVYGEFGKRLDKQTQNGKVTFRNNAKRALLIVSNADSENTKNWFNADDFLVALKKSNQPVPMISSFDSGNADFARLAQVSGGIQKPINSADWGPAFTEFTNKLLAVSGHSVVVPGVSEITAFNGSLTIGGKVAPETCFSFGGNSITVSAECVKKYAPTGGAVTANFYYR